MMKREEEIIRVKQSEVLDLINSLKDKDKVKIGNYIVCKVDIDTFKLSNLIDSEVYMNLIKDTLGEVELID